MNKSLDSYAFADKLILADAGCVHIGNSLIEKNELQLDGNKFFTIHLISFHNWVDLLYKVVNTNNVNSGESLSPNGINITVFDSFDMKKEYNCKIDSSCQSLTVCKKLEKEDITISRREAIEILYMLSFLIIPCLGLPAVISVCFSPRIFLLCNKIGRRLRKRMKFLHFRPIIYYSKVGHCLRLTQLMDSVQ